MKHASHALVLHAGLIAAVLAAATGAQSIQSYGKGTPGTGGKVPALWVTSTARPGNLNYGLTIEQGLPGATAVGFLSLQRQNLTIGGVTVWIDFSTGIQLPFLKLDAAGKGVYKLPLPNQSSLIGIRVMQQAFIADAGGASLGFSATQGLDTRVANFGVLLGTRSTGQLNQPQIAINLDTGVQTTFRAQNQSNVGIPDIYPLTGSHCVMGSGRTNKVALFDCNAFPPRFLKEFSSPFTPWAVSWAPDGQRLYIVEQGARASTPFVRVRWGNPLVPNFGQDYPGNDIPLGAIHDAMRMEFTSDGNTGLLGTLGLLGGSAELRKYDTKVGSPNYNKQIASVQFRGLFMWDQCRIDDNRFAVGVSGLGTQVTVHIIDIGTMKIAKSFSARPFGQVIRGMVAGPRGKYLYVGNAPSSRWGVTAGIVRVNIDPNDPSYGSTTNIAAGMTSSWSVYDVEVTDAGDRIYAIAGVGVQTNFVGKIIEYDATTLRAKRSWSMNRLGNLYHLLIR